MDDDSGSGTIDAQDSQTGGATDPGCCSVTTHGFTDHDVEMDVQAFSALGNETRYEALRLLAVADDEVCACELVPQLDVNQSTTSRALKALHQADLVERRKDGRWRYYSPTPRAEQLLAAIDSTRED